MRILVISDIHANLPAFESVLADAEGHWDQIWYLGDLVGYGPNPNECVTLLRELDHVSLSGNHDWATIGKLDISEFNSDARAAIEWTRSVLNKENHAYLVSLSPSRVQDAFTLAHASPRYPIWEYVLDSYTAEVNLAHFGTPYCLIGHTHIPFSFIKDEADDTMLSPAHDDEPISLKNVRAILNPGSVGQPRDDDPRAAYALLDTDELIWQFKRVPYPIEETQRRMREVGLPYSLSERLAYGW